jgi:hypothetical protein
LVAIKFARHDLQVDCQTEALEKEIKQAFGLRAIFGIRGIPLLVDGFLIVDNLTRISKGCFTRVHDWNDAASPISTRCQRVEDRRMARSSTHAEFRSGPDHNGTWTKNH